MQTNLFSTLLEATAAGTPLVLATVVAASGSTPRAAGAKMLVFADGRIEGTVGGGEMEARVIAESAQALAQGKPRLISYGLVDPGRGDPGVCGGEVQIYLEPYTAPPTVLIIGAGHVGRAVAHLAHWLGYRVLVNDDRPEMATPQHIPHADLYLPTDIETALQQVAITPHTFIVAVTRNVTIDRAILPHLVRSPAPYIGLIGSRRRWQETQKLLLADGMSPDDLARIRSPIGLELNAETPEEIAVSIMAEIIMLRRRGSGMPMRQAEEGGSA